MAGAGFLPAKRGLCDWPPLRSSSLRDAVPATRDAVSNVHAVDDDGLEALASRFVERATPGSGGRTRGGEGWRWVFHVLLREANPALVALDERRQRLVSRGGLLVFFVVSTRVHPLQQTTAVVATRKREALAGGGGVRRWEWRSENG